MPRRIARRFAATFLLSALFTVALTSSVARGQDATVRVERPPEGSWRRGALPVPDWVVYASGAVLVCGAAGALVWRAKR